MTGDVQTHQSTVTLDHDYHFVATFDDVPGVSVRFDEPVPVGGGTAPCAIAMLGAAVANCLAASLAFCLRRARVEIKGLEARATTRVGRNDRGRYRIEDIDVQLSSDVVDADGRLTRCEGLFEDFCTVTASVKQGIPVRVVWKRPSA